MPDREIWRGEVASDSNASKTYIVTLFLDGTASCSCPGFMINGVNSRTLTAEQRLKYRCKHIVRAGQKNAPGWLTGEQPKKEKRGKAKAAVAEAAPQSTVKPAAALGIDLSDLDDRSSRADD